MRAYTTETLPTLYDEVLFPVIANTDGINEEYSHRSFPAMVVTVARLAFVGHTTRGALGHNNPN